MSTFYLLLMHSSLLIPSLLQTFFKHLITSEVKQNSNAWSCNCMSISTKIDSEALKRTIHMFGLKWLINNKRSVTFGIFHQL